ncbi:MAG: hypothetical protein K9J16_06755 [Melioribacteraceae bacterium]|nr:hypothetical protein [Melioribacteraceae bacterium]MCF8356813.1 hypothetical protein [Melioribacteraceae bacterium]MCF8394262.1 hypothetical protein [Melioribacteraceae bacterium]MCF8418162.1 hypothetical protein [Melioribacteraceae bacterium]
MELLPIIYTSLTIFAILAVITIISSYISFKVRTKGQLKPHEVAAKEEAEKKKLLAKVKAREKSTKAKKHVSSSKSRRKSRSSEKEKYRYIKEYSQKSDASKPSKRITNTDKYMDLETYHEYKRKQEAQENAKKQLTKRENRIQVINEIQKNTQQNKRDDYHKAKIKKTKTNLKSLDPDNLNRYYDEEGDENLYTLKPKKNNRN